MNISISKGELVFLTITIIFSFTFILPTFSFGAWTGSIFPRIVFSTLIILSASYLLYDYLRTDNNNTEKNDTKEIDQGTVSEENNTTIVENPNNHLAVSIMIIGYVSIGYVFSILIATPIFIGIYSWYVGFPKKVTVSILLISMVIQLSFIEIVNIPLDEGLLFKPPW